ncbi:Ff.00g054290.m01.CDS01 [Fusarium sp. VM40]|nr:Ff.00g054290.m01.CDS01 [Fusarium sp. VM40]
MALGFRLFLLILFATYVAAADDAEFAFNLLSDIAPILALFGDQFARQFTSESLTWVDHFIFAMVPLGIITAITGAIRVQGMPLARAFIGRARENRALVEIELMSSTSGEVCEMFNGSSIVRAMGDPKIAQFLIFPKMYDDLEKDFKPFDQDLKNGSTVDKPKDTCGIYSLEEAEKSKLLYRNEYRGKGSIFFQDLWPPTRRLGQFCLQWLCDKFNRVSRASTPTVTDVESVRRHDTVDFGSPPKSSNPRLPAVSPPKRSNQRLHAVDERIFLMPPNIQLNLSSDHFDPTRMHKGGEIFLAAMIGFFLQTGLIAIAAVTASRLNSSSSGFLQSSVYGFPCYAAGSLLLCLGTGLCSLIVEHSTDEHSWEFCDKDVDKKNAPRILWLQQKQKVNDQSFNGYVISSGPKRRVITSSRRDAGREYLWEVLTIGAALSAGLGFTAQFMGLRGLAFPCSIAQLGAIFIMALVRAAIRRRLGQDVENCDASQWYEIDFLAARIVLNPEGRVFNNRPPKKKTSRSAKGKAPQPKDYFVWKINTPDLQDTSPFLVPLEPEAATDLNVPRIVNPGSQSLQNPSAMGPIIKEPTSQQLLRVRKRVGDLTKWKTRSSACAIALVQSIRLVLDTFPPVSKDKSEPLMSLTWLLKVTFSQSTERQDLIKIPIIRNKSSNKSSNKSGYNWELDAGLIDAALSLWMASIDGKKPKTTDKTDGQKPPLNRKKDDGPGETMPPSTTDWRFSKDDDTLKYSFYRIIGDNLEDGVLKRDISWWADSLHPRENKPGHGVTEDEELVIGFNGINSDDVIDELSVSAEGSLPQILAQHLFTSFMWTVAKHLSKDCLNPIADQTQKEVEIEGAHTFESYSLEQTWPTLRLRHRCPTELVRKIESFGMGRTRDILLCMIPALSYMKILPNQAVLKLIPRVGPGRGWAETASCHRKLLEAMQKDKNSVKDRLHVGIVIATMDFLYFAFEPYGKHVKLPTDLTNELGDIVESLCSPTFADIMEKLVPVYCRQCRQSTFMDIFGRFEQMQEVSNYIQKFGIELKLDQTFAKGTLGFNEYHKRAMEGDTRYLDLKQNDHSAFAQDIFGWTPYHYMSIRKDDEVLRIVMKWSDRVKQRLPKLLCSYSRNPIHLAALKGLETNLEVMLQNLSNEMRRHVLQTGGIDGMTPLHLIAKCGYVTCLDSVTLRGEIPSLLTKKDIWGRQALHIASSSGLEKICVKLLEMGARSDQLDDVGKSSVDYFVESKRTNNEKDTTQSDGALTKDGQTSTERKVSKASYLNKDGNETFLKFAMKGPDCRYGHGRTFLHNAVELADLDTVRSLLHLKFDLEARDDNCRTPLHYAILAGREDMAKELINGVHLCAGDKGEEKHFDGANVAAIDSQGTTTLMFAVRESLKDVAEALLSGEKCVDIDKRDSDEKTALFYATDREMAKLLVDKKCDTTVRNLGGRTSLHMAIGMQQEDIALYLLQLSVPNQIQTDPLDKEGESLLTTACRSGLSALIRPILERWSSLLDKADSEYDQSPLAWACELGHTSVVEELLTFKVDVNRPASKWGNFTPLHICVISDKIETLNHLLDHNKIDLSLADEWDRTALDIAVSYERITALRKLLLHDQTVFSQRVEVLKGLVLASTKGGSKEMIAIVSDGLKSIRDKELIFKFLVWLVSGGTPQETEEPKTMEGTTADAQEIAETDGLLPVADDVEETERVSGDAREVQDQRSMAVFLAPLATYIFKKDWEWIENPYDLLMLLSDDQLRETVRGQQFNPMGLDSDGWSCFDYIERFDRKGVMGSLFGHLKQSETQTVQKPAALSWVEYEESIRIHPCASHGGTGKPPTSDSCNQVHGIEVVGASDEYYRACIRSEHCIPPSSKGFYFEVDVLENSWSGIICIGFCGVDTGYGDCPGWFTRSWAYHGDDGKLFIERLNGIIPSDDFGVFGTFGKGSTVGAGLDMTTGQGFCTLNGKRLNMGNAFEPRDKRFLFAKLYPCVGFDLTEGGTGLRLRVNLDQSTSHPFKYARPSNSD